ncbi:FecCD family ABC transporter permease [Euzebya sp.]|uniref:FecCD family ABC transporter permease n=1 Tax=Euzebya sp. TaxID=1971409 RepID=UPI003512BE4A
MTVDVRSVDTAPAPVAAEPSRRDGLARLGAVRAVGLVLILVLLGVVVVASLAYGARPMAVSEAWESFLAFDPASQDHQIVRTLRVPRTLIGLAVGAALGLAGAVMQGITRNPLADPGILGVNAGAAVGVVLAIYLLGIGSAVGWMAFAMTGALGASVLVYGLASRGRGGATPVKLALAGAATQAMLQAVTSAVILLDVRTLDQFRFWVVGSLTGRDLDMLVRILPFLAAGVVLALGMGRTMNALSLGEDVAAALGQRVAHARLAGVAAVMLLVGSAVSIAGPLWFVGLVVPHVARGIVGPDHRWILVYSAVLGPVLLLIADVLGRLVVRPGELQVGIVTALIGAPLFIALVRRRRLVAL